MHIFSLPCCRHTLSFTYHLNSLAQPTSKSRFSHTLICHTTRFLINTHSLLSPLPPSISYHTPPPPSLLSQQVHRTPTTTRSLPIVSSIALILKCSVISFHRPLKTGGLMIGLPQFMARNIPFEYQIFKSNIT